MQIYGIRMFNFCRFGESCNSIVFDVSPENMTRLNNEDDSLTMDALYDELRANPVSYINDVKGRGITDLLAICGVKGDNYDKSNGVGKSTTFEAICYAHYDRIVRRSVNTEKTEKAGTSVVTKLNGEYPKGLRESYVEEIFEEKGKIYRIKRGRTFTESQKSHSPLVEFECINEDDIESRAGHRTTDTNEAIAQVTPWDYDIFVNGAMFAQNDAGKFLTGTDKIRKEMLISLLSLEDVVIACLERIRDRKNKKSKENDGLISQVDILKENLREKEPVNEIESKIKARQKELTEADKKIEGFDNEIEKLSKSDSIKAVDSIKEEGKKVKSDMLYQEEQKKAQVQEWQSLQDETIKRGKAQKEKIDSFEEKRKKFKEELKKKTKLIKEFDMASREDSLRKIEKAKKAKGNYLNQVKDLRDKKEKNLEDIATKKGDYNRIEKEITSLVEQLENVSGDEFVCDKCKSKVSREHVQNEISKNKTNSSKYKEELQKLSEKQKKVVEELDESERRLDIINDWLIKEEKIKSEIKGHNDDKKALEELRKQDDGENEDTLKELQNDKEALKKQAVEYEYKIEKISETYDKKSKELKERLDEIADKYKKAKKIAEDVQAKINELKQRKSDMSSLNAKANSWIGSAKKEIEAIKNDSKKIKKLEGELGEGRLIYNRLVILEDVFGLEGIQTRIVKKYLPLLNVYIKEFLDILSNGEMGVELFINDRSKVDISITGGSADTYVMLSGGEKILVKLAVDIGLALLSFSRCAQKPEIICLDEVFGQLDSFNTKSVFSLLQNLRNRFNRVILISHERDINDNIPHKIFIEKDDGDFGRSKFRNIT